MIDQTCKIRWAFAGMESRVHSEIELFDWQCGFEGFLSQTVGLWCGFGGWVLWNWRLGTDGLEVGHWWFGGWVLWFWILGTTVGASLVVQRGAGNGAPCPAPVPNPPPLLCSIPCSASSEHNCIFLHWTDLLRPWAPYHLIAMHVTLLCGTAASNYLYCSTTYWDGTALVFMTKYTATFSSPVIID